MRWGYSHLRNPCWIFTFWREDLASPLWGAVRGAARVIAKDYVPHLSDQERVALDAYAGRILEVTAGKNSRIWLTWLRCQLDKRLDIGRAFLRQLVDDSPLTDEGQWDLGTDACYALASMPNVTLQDIHCILRYILRSDIHEYSGAAALESVMSSPFVSEEVKRGVKEALKKGRPEVQELVDSP